MHLILAERERPPRSGKWLQRVSPRPARPTTIVVEPSMKLLLRRPVQRLSARVKPELDAKAYVAKSIKTTVPNICINQYPEIQESESILITPKLADLVSNLVEDVTKPLSTFSPIHELISTGNKNTDMIKSLNQLQTAFGVAKSVYPESTLNYEGFDMIQNNLIQLMNALERNDLASAKTISKEVLETLEMTSALQKELRSRGLRPRVLEDTGRTVGGMRVFRLQKNA